MRIDDHLLQGITILFIFLYATSFITEIKDLSFLSFFLFSFAFLIGLIYPDVDERKCQLFKPRPISKTNTSNSFLANIQTIKNNFFKLWSLLIPLAYTLRILIYYPSYFLSKKIINGLFPKSIPVTGRHREISHSLFGSFLSFLFILFYGFIISQRYPYDLTILLKFACYFFIGSILHLIQDLPIGPSNESSNFTGIRLFFPFSNFSIKGNLSGDYWSFKDLGASVLSFVLIAILIVNYLTLSKIYSFIITLFISGTRINFTFLLYHLIIVSLVYVVFLHHYKITIFYPK